MTFFPPVFISVSFFLFLVLVQSGRQPLLSQEAWEWVRAQRGQDPDLIKAGWRPTGDELPPTDGERIR